MKLFNDYRDFRFGQCQVIDCHKPRQHASGQYCAMHLARYIRNGSTKTQKELGVVYNTKLGTLSVQDLDYIKDNSDKIMDKDMAKILRVPLHTVRYARRKVWGHKYKGLNKRTYLKAKYKKLMNNTCEICGWHEAPCDVHHKIPLAQGGQDSLGNYICLCPNHHRTYHYRLAP